MTLTHAAPNINRLNKKKPEFSGEGDSASRKKKINKFEIILSFYRWSYWPVEKCWAKVFILWKLLWWRETCRFQLTIVVGMLIMIKTRNVSHAFQNLHSQEIIFTLTEHSKSALNYRQLTHLFGRRSKGKEDFGCVRSARGARGRREGSGGPRAQIPFPLPFERHAAFQLIFLYGKCIYNCCSVISCRLARKTWNVRKNIFKIVTDWVVTILH